MPPQTAEPNADAIVQWTPLERFQAEPDTGGQSTGRENTERDSGKKAAAPKDDRESAQDQSHSGSAVPRNVWTQNLSKLRSAGTVTMDFSSLPTTPHPPVVGADSQTSSVQCDKFLKSTPQRWQIITQLQKQEDDADMQALSVSKYLEKFSDSRWLTFNEQLLQHEFLRTGVSNSCVAADHSCCHQHWLDDSNSDGHFKSRSPYLADTG